MTNHDQETRDSKKPAAGEPSELSLMTYIVDGQAMSFAQVQAHQAAQSQAAQEAEPADDGLQEIAARLHAETEQRRAQREEDAKNGIHY